MARNDNDITKPYHIYTWSIEYSWVRSRDDKLMIGSSDGGPYRKVSNARASMIAARQQLRKDGRGILHSKVTHHTTTKPINCIDDNRESKTAKS